MSGVRAHIIVAASFLGLEVFLGTGFGCVGVLAGCAFLISFLFNRKTDSLRIATTYILLGIASFAVIKINWHIAKRRAEPVIGACKEFHAKYNQYPGDLRELVPGIISSVPHAGFTLYSRRYLYERSRPWLGFAVMFHGIESYDFQTDRWGENE